MSNKKRSTCTCPKHGKWLAAEDIYRMVRELDVAMNGAGAAKQAMLCDIVDQLKEHIRKAKAVRSVPRDRLQEILEDGAPGPLRDEQLKWIDLNTMHLLLEEGAAGTLGLLVARLSQTVSHYKKLAGSAR